MQPCQQSLSRRCSYAAKLVIISNNSPPIKKSEIEYYAMLSKTGVHHYTGSELLLLGPLSLGHCPLLPHQKPLCSLEDCEHAICCGQVLTDDICFCPDGDLHQLCSLADNVELGTACGKLHRVSVLAITDAGGAHPHWVLTTLSQAHRSRKACPWEAFAPVLSVLLQSALAVGAVIDVEYTECI